MEPGRELGIVVGGARSGTTLLRMLLDAHPEIGCPAEAGLPSLMAHMAGVWATIHADEAGDATRDPGDGAHAAPAAPANLPETARAWIRSTVLQATEQYCVQGAKRLYVDKSLDSVNYLALVHELFPETRYVLAFRHVMDTIASGCEASPWGFNAYGYGPYVQASSGNTVVALARYWLDHVDGALMWEEQHPDVCQRVRYEELVTDPQGAVRALQRFLGVDEDLDVLQSAFAHAQAKRGPGDYKIDDTQHVHSASVGSGKRVPVTLLPPPLLESVNEKLSALGYPELDHTWNATERASADSGRSIWSRQLDTLMAGLHLDPTDSEVESFALVSENHRRMRWVVSLEAGTVTRGDGEVDGVLTGTTEDLVLMLTGEENLGVLMRANRIRYVVADDDGGSQRDIGREIRGLVQILRNGRTGGSAPAQIVATTA